MSGYYQELDDDRGAELEAEEDHKEFLRKINRDKKAFNTAVAKEVEAQLKHHGLKPLPPKPPRGKMVEVKCACGNKFSARTADRKRGWGKFCSKSCKAIYSK